MPCVYWHWAVGPDDPSSLAIDNIRDVSRGGVRPYCSLGCGISEVCQGTCITPWAAADSEKGFPVPAFVCCLPHGLGGPVKEGGRSLPCLRLPSRAAVGDCPDRCRCRR